MVYLKHKFPKCPLCSVGFWSKLPQSQGANFCTCGTLFLSSSAHELGLWP